MVKKGELGIALFASVLILISLSSGLSVNSTYYTYEDVLLVCNPASSISNQTCDYFMQQRPTLTHRLNLTGVSTSESVSGTVYTSIFNQVSNYLASHDGINYIVLTKGVPIMSSYTNYYGSYSVDSLLAYELSGGSYQSYVGKEETFSKDKYGFYIVTRLDGYNFNDIKGLIDRASSSNRPSNALSNGLFVIDEAPLYGISWSDYVKDWAVDNSYSYLYNNISSQFIRNASNVVGYSSWGSNDAAYSSNVLLNSDLTSRDSALVPSNWTVVSGTFYNTSYSSSTPAFQINSSGYFEIYQNYSGESWDRRFSYATRYAYEDFIGNVTIGFISYDSDGNVILSSNTTLISKTSLSNISWTSYNTLKHLNNVTVNKTRVFMSGNLQAGNLYIDYIKAYRISPSMNWMNGAIGTTFVSTSARSFSTSTSYGQTLIADLVHDGITGVEGFVTEPFTFAVADAKILFDRYSKGYNLGDSFYMASSNLNWKDIIIGDPKAVLITPGLRTALTLNQILDGEAINNGTNINISISADYDVLAVNYSYDNGTFYGNYSVDYTEGEPIYINTTSWTNGHYTVTLYLTDSLNQKDQKSYTIIINDTEGLRPNYFTFGGSTTDFKVVTNRTNTTVVLEKTNGGKIDYGQKGLNVSGYDLDSYVTLSHNNITVFSSMVPSLNTSATAYMYALSYNSNPIIYREGVVCNSTTVPSCNMSYYNSTYGELSFNVTSFSSYTTGSNAELDISDSSDYGEIRLNENVTFAANYTDSINHSIITDATCKIEFSDGIQLDTTFNETSNQYEYSKSFSTGGSYYYTFNCTKLGYEQLVTTDTAAISSCLSPTVSEDWVIDSEQTCDSVTINLPADKSIKINSNGNLTLINSIILINNSADGAGGINVNETGKLMVLGSIINTSDSNYFFKINGSYAYFDNSTISGAGWSATEGERGLEIYSNLSRFNDMKLLNNYASVIYSDNNYLTGVTTNGNTIGLWLIGANNVVQDSVLGEDSSYNAYSSDSNTLLNTTSSSSNYGITEKWYFNMKVTDTNSNAVNGVSVTGAGETWTTDTTGWIGQKNVTEESYTLTLSKSGYYSTTNALSLTSNILDRTVQITAIASSDSSSSSGGGGGGGGSSSGSSTSSYTSGGYFFWEKLTPAYGEPTSSSGGNAAFRNGLLILSLNDTKSVQTISISIANSSSNASISIKDIPLNTSLVPGLARYAAFEVKTSNVSVDGARIDFKVDNSWLSSNRIDGGWIALYRLNNNTWETLNTTFNLINNESSLYSADSPEFSIFVIGVEAGKIKNTDNPGKSNTFSQNVKSITSNASVKITVFLMIGALVTIFSVLAFIYWRIERQKVPEIYHKHVSTSNKIGFFEKVEIKITSLFTRHTTRFYTLSAISFIGAALARGIVGFSIKGVESSFMVLNVFGFGLMGAILVLGLSLCWIISWRALKNINLKNKIHVR